MRVSNELVNVRSEKAVIGALLRSKDAYWQIDDRISAHHFYDADNQRIFSAISDICTEGLNLSIDLVCSRAEGIDHLYLEALRADASDVSSPLDFADELSELSAKRKLVAVANKVILEIKKNEKSAVDIAATAEDVMEDIRQISSPKRPKLISSVAIDMIKKAKRDKITKDIAGYDTGLYRIDEILGLILNSDLGFIIGYTGDGKSALGMQIAMHISMKVPVLAVHLEMSEEQVAARELSSLADISVRSLRERSFTEEDSDKFDVAGEYLKKSKMLLYEDKAMTFKQLRSLAISVKRKHGLGAMLVDQLDKVKPDGKFYKDKFEKLQEVTLKLKELAIELNIPIITLAQRTRTAVRRDNPVPQLDDTDSNTIERDGDWVLGVWRKETWLRQHRPVGNSGERLDKWESDIKQCRNVASVICLKTRHGQAYEQRELGWQGNRTRFHDEIQDFNKGI